MSAALRTVLSALHMRSGIVTRPEAHLRARLEQADRTEDDEDLPDEASRALCHDTETAFKRDDSDVGFRAETRDRAMIRRYGFVPPPYPDEFYVAHAVFDLTPPVWGMLTDGPEDRSVMMDAVREHFQKPSAVAAGPETLRVWRVAEGERAEDLTADVLAILTSGEPEAA
jgi:hypothetical protein